MKTTTANLVEVKKGYFLRYSSKGVSRTFATKQEAIAFADRSNIRIK